MNRSLRRTNDIQKPRDLKAIWQNSRATRKLQSRSLKATSDDRKLDASRKNCQNSRARKLQTKPKFESHVRWQRSFENFTIYCFVPVRSRESLISFMLLLRVGAEGAKKLQKGELEGPNFGPWMLRFPRRSVGNRGVGNLRFIGLVGLGPAGRVFTFHLLDSLLTATTKISICPHTPSYANKSPLFQVHQQALPLLNPHPRTPPLLFPPRLETPAPVPGPAHNNIDLLGDGYGDGYGDGDGDVKASSREGGNVGPGRVRAKQLCKR